MEENLLVLSTDKIKSKIYTIRNMQVMLDKDLAELYGVQTKVLNQSVKRNIKRFPSDFMFQLNKKESESLKYQSSGPRSQIVTLKNGRGRNIKYSPYVFTEQGVAMLSSVLNSERAIQVNIQIIRTFTKLRELLATNIKLRKKIESMEKKYDTQLRQVFEVLKQLLMQEIKPKKGNMGFIK